MVPLGSLNSKYPYLDGEGRAAFVTTIDWEAGGMTFLAADVASGDGALDVSDAIRILWHLFIGTDEASQIRQPWPAPGLDPTRDALYCLSGQ